MSPFVPPPLSSHLILVLSPPSPPRSIDPSIHLLPMSTSRLAAGVRGRISRYVTTVPTASVTFHFYELDVVSLDNQWLESHERRREWVDYAEAERRVAWKPELSHGLRLSSLAPGR